MFSIFKQLSNEFNKGLDESKLIDFKNRVKNVSAKELEEICKEIHYIMQRHYQDKNMLFKCNELFEFIESIKKHREEIQYVKTYNAVPNYTISKGFMTKWDY